MKYHVLCSILGIALLQTFVQSTNLSSECCINHTGKGGKYKISPVSVLKPRSGDPFDTIPKSFWQEFSSPFTDPPLEAESEDYTETTTQEPFPFFEDAITTINITAQLGSHVHLHCRVNDLRGKTVSGLGERREGWSYIVY